MMNSGPHATLRASAYLHANSDPPLLHGFVLNSAVQAHPRQGAGGRQKSKDWVHKGRVRRTRLAPLSKTCRVMAAKQCLRPPSAC